MIKSSLEDFVNAVMFNGQISKQDVRRLQRDILPDGVESCDEADVLIALDRAVHDKDGAWNSFMIQAVVDFVVWASRPTGRIDRATAEWLTTSLGAGTGPTDAAVAVAFEVVRESELCDEVLVGFVMQWARSRTPMDTIELHSLAA